LRAWLSESRVSGLGVTVWVKSMAEWVKSESVESLAEWVE